MRIWILGSGAFGVRAARQLSRMHDPGDITLVDPSHGALDGADIPGITTVCDDGVSFLYSGLQRKAYPDWIVPALPVHLAWEWVALCRQTLSRFPLPDSLIVSLPSAMTGTSGDVYVSHADFICPPNCSEPDRLCTATGRPRNEDMFRLLEKNGRKNLPIFVIRSLQLGPGLGGYQPEALFSLLEMLDVYDQGPCAVATACRCHGVVTGAVKFSRPISE